MEEHWITPVDTLTLTRAKSFGSTNGYGLLGTRGGKALPQLWWGLRLSDSSHLRAPNFRKSRFFRVAQNMVRQKIQGGGYKKLDAKTSCQALNQSIRLLR